MRRWGEARGNFLDLALLSEEATRFIREHHPHFAPSIVHVATKSSLASNMSTDALNDGENDRLLPRRGRPRKSNQFYVDKEAEPSFILKKQSTEEPEVYNEDGRRRKRNVGIPRHFENMVMIEHKKRRLEQRERDRENDEEENGSVQAYDAQADAQPKRKRGRPSKTRDEETAAPSKATTQQQQNQSNERSKPPPVIQREEEITPAPKRLTFPEFCDQLRDFFRVLGAWYGVSAPVILHYLREQILVSVIAAAVYLLLRPHGEYPDELTLLASCWSHWGGVLSLHTHV